MSPLLRSRSARVVCALILCLAFRGLLVWNSSFEQSRVRLISRCSVMRERPGHPPIFHQRQESDRFQPGTKATWIKNASIWTGSKGGSVVVQGDILMSKGLIKAVGKIPAFLLEELDEVVVLNAEGAWVTAGIVDIHSHIGVLSLPVMRGALDGNSYKGPIVPWLRSLDGLNTHDRSFELSIAGGVTSAQILPGSLNAIGGQAFVIKLRPTSERSPSSKVIDFPIDPSRRIPPWRHMKHACGENFIPYGTRMDSVWSLRAAYDQARTIKEAQDAFCDRVAAEDWADLGDFPESLQWEALVDVLRGKVKLSVHCYEALDLENIVRLSNEFKFPIASIHHASEAYLVPDLLKKAWHNTTTKGEIPALALFAVNGRYKREAFRASEFAPRVLSEQGFRVAMKSDHPIMDSRYLLFEAQQAHYYGLEANLALASVTSTPAEILGLAHRIGYIRQGYDADVVLFDSHPLSLGATPKQVWIDGIPQLESPHVFSKPSSAQSPPKTPDFEKEIKDTLMFEGLPPLTPKRTRGVVVFKNVEHVWNATLQAVVQSFQASENGFGAVVVIEGVLQCLGTELACSAYIASNATLIDLEGGSIEPGLVSYGSPLGLREIQSEQTTQDGPVYEPFTKPAPAIFGDETGIAMAKDGLQFGSQNALLAYRAGVTDAITAPISSGLTNGFIGGLSVTFRLGVNHALEKGAIIQPVTALHVTLSHWTPFQDRGASVSSQVATLRRLLLSKQGSNSEWFRRAAQGEIRLVVNVHNADIIATLLRLKDEVEGITGKILHLTLSGATEAHLIAEEIAKRDVGVILSPLHPSPLFWEQSRILPGPPLSANTSLTVLLSRNVTVGIGVPDETFSRNLGLDVAWAAIDSNGKLTRREALSLVTVNLRKLLGVSNKISQNDLVAYRGSDRSMFSRKAVGVLSNERGLVDLF